MGYFQSLFTRDTFATVEVATSASIVKNPIDEAIASLFTAPKRFRAKDVWYVKFGGNDDIPAVLQALLNKSSTHAGIVHKKAKMVAGQYLEYDGAEESNVEWQVFSENAGGTNISLDAVFKKAAFYYELQGAVGLRVKKEGSKLVSINAVSPINMRCLPPENGIITNWLLRHSFKYQTSDIWANEETTVPVFTTKESTNDSLIYIKNPHSTNDFYGIPNYISAFNFIEADYEFGVMIRNSAENGFSPKVLATLIGRNLSDDQKREQADKLKTNFQGSDAEQMIVSWVRKPEEAPLFQPLDITNLDKMVEVMSNLNDAKILTAHSVVNPSLFGVQTAGKLGNSGTELDVAYNVFRATETMPTRELILENLNLAFKGTSFEGITAQVVDFPIYTSEQTQSTDEPLEAPEPAEPIN